MSLKFRIRLSVGFGRQINLENNEKKTKKGTPKSAGSLKFLW
jgi:hypothetical protein